MSNYSFKGLCKKEYVIIYDCIIIFFYFQIS